MSPSAMSSQKNNLKLSFTSIALGLREAETALALFERTGDWKEAANVAIEENSFQLTSSASTRRVFSEVRQRLETLTPETLEAFHDSYTNDRRAILLIAICKCYSFIFEFIRSTLADKVTVFDYGLSQADFDAYWNASALEHPELEEITDSTRKKIRQVVFRLLTEAGLLTETKDPQITPIPIPSSIEAVLHREGEIYREVFLS